MESARQGYTAIGGDFEKAFRYDRVSKLVNVNDNNRIKLIIAGCILLTKSVALFTSELSRMGVPLTVGEAMPSDFEPPTFE